MNIVLVNPPIHYLDSDRVYPPLGLLCIAAELSKQGHESTIIDLNLRSCQGTLPSASDFYEIVATEIVALRPDVVAFTSMGTNTHVAVLLATAVKIRLASVTTVVGGPHFASAPSDFLQSFEHIDIVYAHSDPIALPQAIAEFRKTSERTIVGPDPLEQSADCSSAAPTHPFSAYSMLDVRAYYRLQGTPTLCYEVNRGCTHACSFCYSRLLHNRPSDYVSPTQVAADFRELHDLGATRAFLVGDNFANDATAAHSICQRLEDTQGALKWGCYATLSDLSDDLVHHMSAAGCDRMYIGIDALSQAQVLRYRKPVSHHLESLPERAANWIACGVRPTFSYIIDIRSLCLPEINAQLRHAAEMREVGSAVRINSLCMYTGTALLANTGQDSARYSETRLRILQDCPDVVIDNPLALTSPELFPFHVCDVDDSEWSANVLFLHTAQVLVNSFPRTVLHCARHGQRTPWALAASTCALMDTGRWMNKPTERKRIARAAFRRVMQAQRREKAG